MQRISDPVRVTPPAPIMTLGEATDHLRQDSTDDAAYITALIDVAHADVEQLASRKVGEQVWKQDFCGFPGDFYWLAITPANEMVDVTYKDASGNEQTLPDTAYKLITTNRRPMLIFSGSLPETAAGPDAVTVQYKAGYLPASAEYKALQHAAKLILGHFYANREDVIVAAGLSVHRLPHSVMALLRPIMAAYF